jgi:hypothetical protein
MTTIGPVSAGLLTFPQGLGLVFGTNVGTRERAGSWRSLGFASRSSYALPMIFVGALVKLLGNGRIAARGSRARRLSACALRTDDSATGHGRARRACIPWTYRPSLVGQEPAGYPARVRPQDAGCVWARDDPGDAVVDGIHRRHPFGLSRRRGRSGSRLRADHRAEHRNGDQFRNGGAAKRKGKILASVIDQGVKITTSWPRRQPQAAPPRPKPSPYRSSSFRFLHDERR